MTLIRDQAVVLTRLDYSETSQVLVLFTREHGKIRAIAKGVKRSTRTRFAVGIDLLEVGEVVVSVRQERSGGLSTLTEWTQTRNLSSLRDKLPRLDSALYIAEVTAQLTEDHDPHAELFDALAAALETLSHADEALPIVVDYQRGLLTAVGLMPRFDACVLCGRAADLTHFSSLEGGMVCRHCEPPQVEKRQVASTTLQFLTHGSPPPSFTGPFDLLNYHLSHLMGKEPRLAARLIPPSQRRTIQ
jgi:DNA repair protein RecO (recombination protein O)